MPIEDITIRTKPPNHIIGTDNIDELIEQMKKDELEDAVTLTPVNYGKLRTIWPQRVYQAIRGGKLKTQICGCGRRVIVVAEADVIFGFKKEPDEENETETETE